MPTPKRSGPHTEWFSYEIDTLKRLSKTHSSEEIADALGRSMQAVQAQAYRLHISLNRENTTTFCGRKAENDALAILPESKLLTRENYHAPYDMDWNGKRINVKSTVLKYIKRSHCFYWHFTTRQSPKSCDFFLLLGYINWDDKPIKIWLVPSDFYPKKHISISQHGKKNMFQKFVFKEAI
jgi:hypothetical protein